MGIKDRGSSIRKFRKVAKNCKKYNILHYNLDALIAVGYRVGSAEGTAFRRWATPILRDRIMHRVSSLDTTELTRRYIELSEQVTALCALLKKGLPISEDNKRTLGRMMVGIVEKRVPPIVDDKLHGVYRPPGYITINELCRTH